MFATLYGSSTVLEVLFRAKPDVNVTTYAEVHVYTCRVKGVIVCNIVVQTHYHPQSFRDTQLWFMPVRKRTVQLYILSSNSELTRIYALRYANLCGSYNVWWGTKLFSTSWISYKLRYVLCLLTLPRKGKMPAESCMVCCVCVTWWSVVCLLCACLLCCVGVMSWSAVCCNVFCAVKASVVCWTICVYRVLVCSVSLMCW